MTVIEQERIEVKPEVTAPSVVTRREILHRAADLIEEFGWCQGAYSQCEHGHPYCEEHPLGSHCAEGAIMQGLADLGSSALYAETVASLERRVGCALPRWNDQPGRTKAEVISFLRETAERA
jgi:hypothetical protein